MKNNGKNSNIKSLETGLQQGETVSEFDQDLGENIITETESRKAITVAKRTLARSGDLRASLMSGEIDLNQFTKLIKKGLRAMRVVTTKGQPSHEVPDWGTRFRFAKLLIDTVDGTPVRRTETIVRQVASTEKDLEAMVKRSPALRKSMRDLLDRLDAADGVQKKGVSNEA